MRSSAISEFTQECESFEEAKLRKEEETCQKEEKSVTPA